MLFFVLSDSNNLLSVLNSKVSDYYLRKLGVTRNGGYFEYKPMFVGQIPIPINCSQQEELSNLCQQLLNTNNKDLEEKIDFIIYDMYHLDEKEKTYIIQNSI